MCIRDRPRVARPRLGSLGAARRPREPGEEGAGRGRPGGAGQHGGVEGSLGGGFLGQAPFAGAGG
eukprot:6951926-Alexandrium_andersonii.AAC.1